MYFFEVILKGDLFLLRAVSFFFIFIYSNIALADDCVSLWYERNSHWNEAGLCFSTQLGKEVFDNSDCTTNDPFLEPRIVEQVKYIVKQEKILGCLEKKKSWTSAFILNQFSEEAKKAKLEQALAEERAMAQGEPSEEEELANFRNNGLNDVQILNLNIGMTQTQIDSQVSRMKADGYAVKLQYTTPQEKFRTYKNEDGSFYVLPRRILAYKLKKVDANLIDEVSIQVVPAKEVAGENISHKISRKVYYKKSSNQYFDIKKISNALESKYGSEVSFFSRADSFYQKNFVYLDNTLRTDANEKWVECFSWNKKPCLQKTKKGNYYSSCAFQSHKLNFRDYINPKVKTRSDRKPDCTGTVSYSYDRTFDNTGTTQSFTVVIASYRIYFDYLKRRDQVIYNGLINADNGRKGGDAPKL